MEEHNMDPSELENLISQAFPRRRLVRAGNIHAIKMGLGQLRGETSRLVDRLCVNRNDAKAKRQLTKVNRRMAGAKARLMEEHNLDASELENLIRQAFPRRRLVRAGNIHAIKMGLGQLRGETSRLVDRLCVNRNDAKAKSQLTKVNR